MNSTAQSDRSTVPARGGWKRLAIQVGERNGGLVVVERMHRARELWHWLVRCDCGWEIVLDSSALRQRKTCSQCSKDAGAAKRQTHGGARRSAADPLYSTWQGIKTRCSNPNAESHQWYGAKNVRVCDAWLDFGVFRVWALANGWRKGLTFDRVDETKDYGPDNCRIATQSENSKRMRAKYRTVRHAPMFADHFPIEALFGVA